MSLKINWAIAVTINLISSSSADQIKNVNGPPGRSLPAPGVLPWLGLLDSLLWWHGGQNSRKRPSEEPWMPPALSPCSSWVQISLVRCSHAEHTNRTGRAGQAQRAAAFCHHGCDSSEAGRHSEGSHRHIPLLPPHWHNSQPKGFYRQQRQRQERRSPLTHLVRLRRVAARHRSRLFSLDWATVEEFSSRGSENPASPFLAQLDQQNQPNDWLTN